MKLTSHYHYHHHHHRHQPWHPLHLAKINWHDMQKNIDTASNEVLAKVPRLNLGSQVVLGNKKLTGDRRQVTEDMVHLSFKKST
jgi:hypothetical protein